MPKTENESNDEVAIGDLFRPVVHYWRPIWQLTLSLTVIAALLAAIYFVVQPTLWSASLEVRLTFEGADAGRYPNGLPFAASDIVAASVVDEVFAKNDLQNYCSIETFRSGLTVQESSAALQMVDAEYQARLSDVRLTTVDRQRLQDEYTARRASMPRSYHLTFIRPLKCTSLPDRIALKVLSEIVEEWAIESQTRRGVLNVRTARLSPEILDTEDDGDSLVIKADLLRLTIGRVIDNVVSVQSMAGAELVRAGDPPISLAEVHARLEDLVQARLDPLLSMAGLALGDRQSTRWLTMAMEAAQVKQKAAEARVEALRQALREYSGVSTTPSAVKSATVGQTGSDVGTLTPQIDKTFIDGIVALSASNTAFRQEITRQIITASSEVVSQAQTVDHYRRMLTAINRGDASMFSASEFVRRLDTIRANAKAATRAFGQIYDEFSRVAFRAGSALYRVDQPAQATTLRAFSLRSYVLLVVAVFLSTPVILSLVCLILFHLRRYVRSTVPA